MKLGSYDTSWLKLPAFKFHSPAPPSGGTVNKKPHKLVGDLVHVPPLSNFKGLPFRNKGLNQKSVDTLKTGNVGHHYTKIS